MKKLWVLLLLFYALPALGQQVIDPRLLPPGVVRQMQVDGVNLPTANPLTDPTVNLRDTSEILVTNPSAGNIDMTINTGAVTDAKIAAGGITTRSKLPAQIAYEDEANSFGGAVTINGTGSFSIAGSTSGTILLGRSAAAGTYNFNLPTSAGTAGQPLISGGGGAAPMTFGVLGLSGGGTGASSWIASRCVRVNAAGTALEVAGFDCGTGTGGAITTINGTTNEISVAGGTGPTATISIPTVFDLSSKILQGGSPLKFEGGTTNAFTTAVIVTDPTANRTFTLPNANSVAVQPQTAGANSFLTGIDSLGGITTGQLDSDLIALGNNTGTGLWVISGPGTGAARSIDCVATETSCTNGSGVAGNPTIGVHANVVKTDRAAVYGAFLHDFRGSILDLPNVTSDPATTNNGRIALNTATGNLRVIVTSAVRSVLLNGTDCPAGPVTYTAANGSLGLGCGTYPSVGLSGTTGNMIKFTTSTSGGNSNFLREDGTGLLITGTSRYGTTGTNQLTDSYAAITGTKTRNKKNADGDEAVTTGTLTSGNLAQFDAQGRLIQGPAAAAVRVVPCEVTIGDPGAASPALANDNDDPSGCKNVYGVTLTITAVACYAPAGSPTVRPQITGGASNTILSADLTCSSTAGGAAGTLNGTPTQTSNQTIDTNIVTAGGTAKIIKVYITRTLPAS